MSARLPQVGDRWRFKNDHVEVIEFIPAEDHFGGVPALRYAWLTEIDVDPAIRDHSSRDEGRLIGLARAAEFVRTATLVVRAATTPAEESIPGAEYGDATDAAGAEYLEAQRRAESYDGSWYECTDCNMVSCCPSSASDEEHEQWQQDVAEHEERHRDDDGTEAESLAEVSVPAFPHVLVHGRAGAA